MQQRGPSDLPDKEDDQITIKDLKWEDKELVLRVLFAKMNGLQQMVSTLFYFNIFTFHSVLCWFWRIISFEFDFIVTMEIIITIIIIIIIVIIVIIVIIIIIIIIITMIIIIILLWQ